MPIFGVINTGSGQDTFYEGMVKAAANWAIMETLLPTTPAAGDMVYYSSSTELTNIAKGTALQSLRMNSGATAPEWGSGNVVQMVNVMSGSLVTGSTLFVADDTIPQNNEGIEAMTLAITPLNTSNLLVIFATVLMAHSAAGTNTIALFQDTTANALGVVSCGGTANVMETLNLVHKMAAGTTSSTTFKIRFGGHASGTSSLNGASGARVYGGVASSSITILEFAA